MGFRLRLIELGRGAVNVVLQPGRWDVPRPDHLRIALDEEADPSQRSSGRPTSS